MNTGLSAGEVDNVLFLIPQKFHVRRHSWRIRKERGSKPWLVHFNWQVSAHAAAIVMDGEILGNQGLHSPAERRKIADFPKLDHFAVQKPYGLMIPLLPIF